MEARPQETASLVSLSTPVQPALQIVAANKKTQTPLFLAQSQPATPQVQEEDMSDALEVKEEEQMSDALPAVKEDE